MPIIVFFGIGTVFIFEIGHHVDGIGVETFLPKGDGASTQEREVTYGPNSLISV